MAGETFYGEWIVAKVVAYGPASIYSSGEAQKLVGKTLSYSDELARYEGKICSQPVYRTKVTTAGDYLALEKVALDKLGINAASVVRVTVRTGQSTWDSVGAHFLIKSSDELVLYSGGVYFLLTRIKKDS